MNMTAADKKTRQAELNRLHTLYHDYNQHESGNSRTLAQRGHPLAKLYAKVAQMYFSLYYCSNASRRLLAYKASGSEQVSLGLPQIREKREMFEINGEKVYCPYPNDPGYPAFLDAFATAGFPGSYAFVGCIFTTIDFDTRRDDVLDAIRDHVSNEPHLCMEKSYMGYTIELSRVDGKAPPVAVFVRLMALLKKLFKPYLLRAPKQQLPAETPFSQRAFRLANVKSVTIGPHSIKVPLLSLDDQEHNFSVVQQIERLLQNGYPFAGDVEQYLSGIVKPKKLSALKKQYAA